MRKAAMTEMTQRAVMVISGAGCGTSATIGATTVKPLATRLHIPIAVPVKTLGNRSRCPMIRP